ncbi:MAG TPA: LLM class flavin-dependent oxidoreductase [Actinomycetota bacterium]|nr:LLM class flavin-dependent oxidoreductase [Actinomycetota bacterium]
MKVGVILPLFGGDPVRVLDRAQDAEAFGFDGVFAFDHFFPPGAPSDRPALEAFTMLAAVAEGTERVSLGTLVTRASLRPAGLIAKMASMLDWMSGGRMILGIGTGDPIDEPEHVAFGFRTLSVQDRRAHLSEAVRALKALFAGERWGGGEWIPAMDGPLVPEPVQPGGPPVWIGAQADSVVRMAGAIADGWNGWGMDPARYARKVAVLRAAAEEAGREELPEPTWAGIVLVGRDRPELEALVEARRARGLPDEAWTGTVDELVHLLDDLAGAGAAWTIMVPAGPRDRWTVIALEVLPRLTRAGSTSGT